VRHAQAMQVIERVSHPLGDLLRMDQQNAILHTYFRNNILHLFAMPSLMACCFLNNPSLRTEDLVRLAWRIYPYIAAELFLPWREDQVPEIVQSVLDQFAQLQLIERNADGTEWRRRSPLVVEAMQLSVLAQGTIQIVQRYYMAIALLIQAGSGLISQDALVKRCHLMAQRISMLYELNSPEFFDKTLFSNFIDLLRERGVLQTSADNRLLFNEVLLNVANDAQLVLSEQIRHSILQVTHA
jgi:glycerol-3-phosphate O-acyltransferase